LSTASATAPPKKRRGRPPKQATLIDAVQPSEATTEQVMVQIQTCDKNSEYILARPLRWFPVRDIITRFDKTNLKIGDKVALSTMIDGILYNIHGTIYLDLIENIPNALVSLTFILG
jgi:hypothetical protein